MQFVIFGKMGYRLLNHKVVSSVLVYKHLRKFSEFKYSQTFSESEYSDFFKYIINLFCGKRYRPLKNWALSCSK